MAEPARSSHPAKEWLREAGRVDTAVYDAIAQTPTESLDRSLSRLSRAADYSRISIAAAALLAAFGGRRGRSAARSGLASVAVTSASMNLGLKHLVRRPRPDQLGTVPTERHIPMPTSASFPSGHSAAAFAFASGVGAVLPAASFPLRLVAALVGYSRVHTGVHYPGDVVAGALLGGALAQVTTHALARRFPGSASRGLQDSPPARPGR